MLVALEARLFRRIPLLSIDAVVDIDEDPGRWAGTSVPAAATGARRNGSASPNPTDQQLRRAEVEELLADAAATLGAATARRATPPAS